MAKAKPGTNGAKPTAEKPLAVYVTSLSVENVRCFGPKQTLDLSDGKGGPARWTIILGENGTGKTTLLQSLAAFDRQNIVISLDETQFAILEPLMHQARGTRPKPGGDRLGFLRHVTGEVPTRCEVLVARLTGLGGVQPPERASFEWERVGGFLQTQLERMWAMTFFAYGAGRRLGRGALGEAIEDSPTGTLFDDYSPLRNAEEWLLQLELASLRPSDRQERFRTRSKQVQDLLTGGLLPDVDDIRTVTAPDPRPVPHIEFHTPYGWVPLRRLGYGYQTLLAWVVDFASRMVERYPDSPDPLKEPAIVVVDEIDLHLHPAWQRKLVPFLTERFPNTQFIATAHSPLTVQAAEGANLAVLRRPEGKDYVEIDNRPESVRGWRVDQILTSDLFGLYSSRSPSVDRLYKRNEELAVKGRLTKAEKKEFAAIQAELSALPRGDSAAFAAEMAAIKEAIDLLKKRSPNDPHSQAGGPNGAGHPRG